MARESIVRCDVCNEPIDSSQPWYKLIAPLTRDDADRLVQAQLKASGVPEQFAHNPLAAALAGGLPNAVRLDICPRCIDTHLPQIQFAKVAAVESTIDEKRTRANALIGE